jgi:hypothetical protein
LLRRIGPARVAQRDRQVGLAYQGVRVVRPEHLSKHRRGAALKRLRLGEVPRVGQAIAQVDHCRQGHRVLFAQRLLHARAGVLGELKRLTEPADGTQVAGEVVRGHERVRVVGAKARRQGAFDVEGQV